MAAVEPDAVPECYRTSVDVHILSLVLTEVCNLRCSYCYQPNRGRGTMPLQIAKAAITEALEKDDEFREVTIELIGGEVLIQWTLVTELVEWAIERRPRWKKQFAFFIDTNGTLLDDRKKAWIREHAAFVTMGLSLDGTRAAHNRNRSNSYDRVAPHLDFFAELWPHQIVKMTIAPATIGQVFDGIVHIMRNGLRVAANLPLEDIWGSPEEKRRAIATFKEQIERLVDFFGEQEMLPLPSLINLPIDMFFVAEERDRPWCGSGRSMSGVDVDGTWLPCNRYARMSFDRRLLQQEPKKVDSRCSACFFRPACPTCEAHNWEITGNPNVRTSFHCEFIKLQIWGTAQVRALRLQRMVKSLRDRLQSPINEEHHKAIIDRLQFAYALLENVAAVLRMFEETESLETGGPFQPPPRPVWTIAGAEQAR